MKAKILSILMVLVISVMAIPSMALADTGVYLTLTLDNKNPDTWARIDDSMSGSLLYNTSGAKFDYSFTATGLEAGVEYSLIYYANPYPGNFPGKLINTAVADGSGNLSIPAFGGIELGMSLPTAPDSNMVTSHAGAPDFYAHPFGAKIWLVPTACYDGTKITTWSPTRFLFETDLITYTDTDLGGGTGIPITTVVTEPSAILSLGVSPFTGLDFGSVEIGSCSTPDRVITLTNTGTVPIKVTAIPSAGFYTTSLKFDGVLAKDWESVIIPATNPDTAITVNAKVCPLAGLTGTVTGSVAFMATFSP